MYESSRIIAALPGCHCARPGAICSSTRLLIIRSSTRLLSQHYQAAIALTSALINAAAGFSPPQAVASTIDQRLDHEFQAVISASVHVHCEVRRLCHGGSTVDDALAFGSSRQSANLGP